MNDARPSRRATGPAAFKPLLREGSKVPAEWHGTYCLALPAEPRWVVLDYAAVMASRMALHGLFAADDPWPPADLTQAEDEADLAWHQREFAEGRSFAYSLFSFDRQRCLGCLYLYPTASPEHDGEAYLWTSRSEPAELRQQIEKEVMQWLEQAWPFQALAWPGRRIPFRQWSFANYYAECREQSETVSSPATTGQTLANSTGELPEGR